MTRAFHVAAALLVLVVIWLRTVNPQNEPAPPWDMPPLLKPLLAEAGLSYVSEKSISGEGTAFIYRSQGCGGEIFLILYPDASRIPVGMSAALKEQFGPVEFVHDRDIVAGMEKTDIGPRIVWRQILVGLHLRGSDAWNGAAIALATPKGCAPPQVAWRKLPILNKPTGATPPTRPSGGDPSSAVPEPEGRPGQQ